MAGDDDQYLSITDISRYFSLPESTCRYYCKRFSAFIDSVGEGRSRKYSKRTLNVIAVVLEEMKQSKTAAAVEDVLANRFPKVKLFVPDKKEGEKSLRKQPESAVAPQAALFSPAALSLLERQTVALEGIARLLSAMVGGSQSPALPGATGSTQEVSALQKRIEHLETMLGESEKIHQADFEQLQTWLQRIIRRVQKTQSA